MYLSLGTIGAGVAAVAVAVVCMNFKQPGHRDSRHYRPSSSPLDLGRTPRLNEKLSGSEDAVWRVAPFFPEKRPNLDP